MIKAFAARDPLVPSDPDPAECSLDHSAFRSACDVGLSIATTQALPAASVAGGSLTRMPPSPGA